MRQFRIVTDDYLGYEVQHKRWWWPFWVEVGLSNTHYSAEDAKAWAHKRFCTKEVERFSLDCSKDPEQKEADHA